MSRLQLGPGIRAFPRVALALCHGFFFRLGPRPPPGHETLATRSPLAYKALAPIAPESITRVVKAQGVVCHQKANCVTPAMMTLARKDPIAQPPSPTRAYRTAICPEGSHHPRLKARRSRRRRPRSARGILEVVTHTLEEFLKHFAEIQIRGPGGPRLPEEFADIARAGGCQGDREPVSGHENEQVPRS